jgi:hypothetical protein
MSMDPMNPSTWLNPQTWDALDKLGILLSDFTLAVGLAGTGWAFLRRKDIRRWMARFAARRLPPVGFDLESRQRWDAIAFTVSNAEVPLRVLERHLDAGRVGLIFSEKSRPAAEEIKAFLRTHGKPPPEEQVIHNVDDPAEARRKTRFLLDLWRADNLATLAVDVTGGKTPMSLGAFLAAEEAGASTLYVTAEYDPNLRKPNLDTAQVRCLSRPEAV